MCVLCCKLYFKRNYAKNIDKNRNYARERYLENSDLSKSRVKKWAKNNPNKVIGYRKRDKSRLDIRISDNLRSRFRAAIKGNYKNGSAVQDMGCSIIECKEYIELLWKPGMSWDNYGLLRWHIDHIIPLSKFDLTVHDQIKRACHYTNLQPLWAKDNLRKGSK